MRTACNSEVREMISTIYRGKKIYFCEQECLDEFMDDPEKFIGSDHFLVDFNVLENIEVK